MAFSTPFKLALARILRSRNLSRVEDSVSLDPPREVTIQYIKKSGEEVQRTIQAYEVKPHRTSGTLMLYASDTLHGAQQIHSFIANRIRSVGKTDETFQPVWPLKLGESE